MWIDSETDCDYEGCLACPLHPMPRVREATDLRLREVVTCGKG